MKRFLNRDYRGFWGFQRFASFPRSAWECRPDALRHMCFVTHRDAERPGGIPTLCVNAVKSRTFRSAKMK
ncbi:MAG: hypothetical protein R2941_22985 [Desulfobacterales bacterium]